MKIDIPEKLGEISRQFINDMSDKTIIIIPQKAFDRYSHEKGICNVLNYLATTYKLKLAMPEGATGVLDVSLLKTMPDTEVRYKVSDTF